MERITAAASECFFVSRNHQQEAMINKKAAPTFLGILKDCLILSVVIMIGATLTFLIG